MPIVKATNQGGGGGGCGSESVGRSWRIPVGGGGGVLTPGGTRRCRKKRLSIRNRTGKGRRIDKTMRDEDQDDVGRIRGAKAGNRGEHDQARKQEEGEGNTISTKLGRGATRR